MKTKEKGWSNKEVAQKLVKAGVVIMPAKYRFNDKGRVEVAIPKEKVLARGWVWIRIDDNSPSLSKKLITVHEGHSNQPTYFKDVRVKVVEEVVEGENRG